MPTTLKLLHGNPGKRALPSHEPTPPKANLQVPLDLGDTGRGVWDRLAVLLDTIDVVTELDLLAFHTYCRCHDEIAACDDAIAGQPVVVSSKGTLQNHPMVNQRFKWLELKRRYEAEFGMTPSSRSSVQTTRQPTNRIPKRQRA